ncbi:MAG: glycosyltransferase family 4 protein [Burkholderiaceae bacterium]|nr:glycosyltransferase family 4 protein [Burkholderiaceae bacterium]
MPPMSAEDDAMALRILLEMRPALDGHGGIPQETRLLFRELSSLQGVRVEGLLQSSSRMLARGLPADESKLKRLSLDRRIDRLARVVVALERGAERSNRLMRLWQAACTLSATGSMLVEAAMGRRQALGRFEAGSFRDFVWRALFARTLEPTHLDTVTDAGYRVARLPWSAQHFAGLLTRRLGHALYPMLDTTEYDILIAETPYPGRVPAGTRMVVRYHDAIPLLMPHTISNKAHHQASHYEALRRNVRDGAWFACVSEATRRDLLSIFPQAASRAVTIPNIVSEAYRDEPSSPERVAAILHTRSNDRVVRRARALAPRSASLTVGTAGSVDYLLMVSTIEPRKNHLSLLAAWEQLRAEGRTGLQLVLVGMLGWQSKGILRKLLPWVARGGVHVLDEVPTSEMRTLYRHALVTVCPSFGEGFGFSGVEAMRCGGIVAASDLPVHREVYADAAEYFDPYAVADLVQSVRRLIDPDSTARREALARRGAAVASRYEAAAVLPQWQRFLQQVGRAA